MDVALSEAKGLKAKDLGQTLRFAQSDNTFEIVSYFMSTPSSASESLSSIKKKLGLLRDYL